MFMVKDHSQNASARPRIGLLGTGDFDLEDAPRSVRSNEVDDDKIKVMIENNQQLAEDSETVFMRPIPIDQLTQDQKARRV